MKSTQAKLNKTTQSTKLTRTWTVVAVLCCLIPCSSLAAVNNFAESSTEEETVRLVIDFNGTRDENIEIDNIPYRDEMTVEQVLREAMKSKGLRFRSRGRSETFFVLEIAGQANEGARGKNWIFLVDDKLGDRGAGAFKVPSGGVVKWHFGKYTPDRS